VSYPPRRYDADEGAVSAFYRPATTPADLVRPAGGEVHYLATGATTAGELGLYRWDMDGAPSGPQPHFHRSISESFYVLGGTVRLFDGARWIDATTGDFLYVPPGGLHAFRNESGEPASMLLLFTPGAPREEYFEALSGPGWRERLAEDEAAFFLRHDTFWA
jgi:mannose-6-phosphate isomerase-like protein (cupin superfamily)